MNDEQILQLFWERSQESLVHMREKYGRLIQSVCGNILSDPRDAEEAAADTYLRLWRSIPPARPDNLKAYAIRLSRNAALDLLRSRNREKHDSRREVLFSELDRCLPARCTNSEKLEEQELAAQINRYLHTLDSISRSLFIRRYYFTEDLDTLSKHFHMAKPVISARLYRIRKGLRSHLEKEGYSL